MHFSQNHFRKTLLLEREAIISLLPHPFFSDRPPPSSPAEHRLRPSSGAGVGHPRVAAPPWEQKNCSFFKFFVVSVFLLLLLFLILKLEFSKKVHKELDLGYKKKKLHLSVFSWSGLDSVCAWFGLRFGFSLVMVLGLIRVNLLCVVLKVC